MSKDKGKGARLGGKLGSRLAPASAAGRKGGKKFSLGASLGLGVGSGMQRTPSQVWGLVRSTQAHADIPNWPIWDQAEIDSLGKDGGTTASARRTAGGSRKKADPVQTEQLRSVMVRPWRHANGAASCFDCSRFVTLHQNTAISEHVKTIASEISSLPPDCCPWSLIYPKGPDGLPQYNPSGMYMVKLFWMGDWRKIEIDNHVPIEKINVAGAAKAAAKCTLSRLVSSLMIDDEEVKSDGSGPVGRVPKEELWPTILTKAVLNVVQINIQSDSDGCPLGNASIVHMLTGFSPEFLMLRAFQPLVKHVAEPTDPQESAWAELFGRLDKASNRQQRVCTASFREIEEEVKPRSSHGGDGRDAAGSADAGDKQGKTDRAARKAIRNRYKEVGLNPDSSQTVKVCELREFRHPGGDVLRLMKIQSPHVVWGGRLNWTDAEGWDRATENLLGVRRGQQLASLRRSMQLHVSGEDHPPFESWMYFEDFQEFFDFVTIYRDPAMFKHQSVFHRGRTQPESTPADRARLRKKKTISRPKSSRLLSGSNAGAQEDTVRMISTATEPTALLVTFSAFGSKEKFLDGSSLPPGLLTVSVVHPFGKSTEVRRLYTSFVASTVIEVPAGREVIEFTISGSVRNAITVSSDAECKIDTAHATAVLSRESEFLEAHATSFMTVLRDAIALLDFTAISPDILKRIRTNPLFAIDSLTFDRILEWLLKYVERRIANLYPADGADGAASESVDAQLALAAAPAGNTLGATAKDQKVAGTPPVLIILSHSDEQIESPTTTSASTPLRQHDDSGAQLPPSSSGDKPSGDDVVEEEKCPGKQKLRHWREFLEFVGHSYRTQQRQVAEVGCHGPPPSLTPDEAAALIQGCYRRYRNRKCWVTMLLSKIAASRVIQRYFRGHQARRRVSMMRQKETQMETLLRTMVTRSWVYNIHSIQAREKREALSDKYDPCDEELMAAVIKMQAVIRCVMFRKRYLHRKQAARRARVKVIQDVWDQFFTVATSPTSDGSVSPLSFGAVGTLMFRDLLTAVPEPSTPAILDSSRMTHSSAYPYFNDLLQTSSTLDFTGAYQCDLPDSVKLLFRESFQVQRTTRLKVEVEVTGPLGTRPARIRVYRNSDRFELDTSPLCLANKLMLLPEPSGYTFIGEAAASSLPGVSGRWSLNITADRPGFGQLTEQPMATFDQKVFVGCYAKPNPWCSLFRIRISLRSSQVLSFYLQTDQPRVLVRLRLLDDETELATTGLEFSEAHLPFVPLGTDIEPSATLLTGGRGGSPGAPQPPRKPSRSKSAASDWVDAEGTRHYILEALAEGFDGRCLLSGDARTKQMTDPAASKRRSKSKPRLSPRGIGSGGGGSRAGSGGTRLSDIVDADGLNWRLQICNQQGTTNTDVVATMTNMLHDAIDAKKQSWLVGQPGRFEASHALRDAFLDGAGIRLCGSSGSGGDGGGSSDTEVGCDGGGGNTSETRSPDSTAAVGGGGGRERLSSTAAVPLFVTSLLQARATQAGRRAGQATDAAYRQRVVDQRHLHRQQKQAAFNEARAQALDRRHKLDMQRLECKQRLETAMSANRPARLTPVSRSPGGSAVVDIIGSRSVASSGVTLVKRASSVMKTASAATVGAGASRASASG